jgi:hypothetical protein
MCGLSRAFADRANWLASCASPFDDRVILGNDVDGKLYYLDGNSQKDGDDFFVLEAIGHVPRSFPHGLIFDALEVDAVRGVGVTGSDVHAADPQLMLDWSDDGGRTWQGGLMRSLGRQAVYNTSVSTGSADARGGRLFRSAPRAGVPALLNVVAGAADVAVRLRGEPWLAGTTIIRASQPHRRGRRS